MSRTAIFPGTFNPFTKGHADIVERGLPLFDRVVIAIGCNPDKPESSASALRRAGEIERLYEDDPRIAVEVYSGLTVELALRLGARFILRGVRDTHDFEYERNLAEINRRISGVETVILLSAPELACVSSSAVRELASHGYDVSRFLP
ncbi:MAG: pantetheine-phosphate adenylyltransferase [Muribaculaceae bacterium]|nr:pantetheine-phosphate adenylyltransferase [Muribaculaceae bacterium]